MPLRKPALALVAVGVVLGTGGAAAQPPVVAPLRIAGIAADPRAPDGIRPLLYRTAARQLRGRADAAQRRWLASGLVPGVTAGSSAPCPGAPCSTSGCLTRPDGAVAASLAAGMGVRLAPRFELGRGRSRGDRARR